MPKSGPQPPAPTVKIIRGVFKKVVRDNKIFADLVNPKVKASTVRPEDRARVVACVRLFRTNKALRDAVRSELRGLGVRLKRKKRGK